MTEWITKDSANQQGIDLIAYDPETDEYVLIEAKFTSRSGNVGKGDLSITDSGRQMPDQWVLDAINRMEAQDPSLISADLADDLETGIATENVRKKMVVVKNTPRTGKTVTDSITDPGIDRTTVIKTGEVVDT